MRIEVPPRASPPSRPARRAGGAAALLCLLAALPGCALPPPVAIPVADASDPPRAAAVEASAIRIGTGERREVATLIQQNGPLRMWRSQGGLVVATDGPRIVSTAGLSVWLAATRRDGPEPLEDSLALLGAETRTRRVVDLMPPNRQPDRMQFGLGITCTLRGATVPEGLLIEERCTGDAGGFTNRFWADPTTGAIFRSEQWVGTDRPLILEAAE